MAALLADAQLVLAVLLVTDAGNLTTLGANEIDVGGVDGSLLRNDAALLVGSVGLDGLLDDRNALDNDLVLGGESTQDNALLAAILTRENLTLSPFLIYIYLPNYRVSGASETIFMYFVTKLASDGPEDTGADGRTIVADDDAGVVIKANVGAILAADLLNGANDDATDNVLLLDVGARGSLLTAPMNTSPMPA